MASQIRFLEEGHGAFAATMRLVAGVYDDVTSDAALLEHFLANVALDLPFTDELRNVHLLI